MPRLRYNVSTKHSFVSSPTQSFTLNQPRPSPWLTVNKRRYFIYSHRFRRSPFQQQLDCKNANRACRWRSPRSDHNCSLRIASASFQRPLKCGGRQYRCGACRYGGKPRVVRTRLGRRRNNYMLTNLLEPQLRGPPGNVILGIGTLLVSAAVVIAGLASAGSLLWSALR